MFKPLSLLIVAAFITTAAVAKTVEITLLHVNDVYEMQASNGGKYGGLARVSGLLKQLKAKNPNTFSILSGDYLSPSAAGTSIIDGKRVSGEQMVDVLNAMNWDYSTLGNHEFDNGYQALLARLAESKFTVFSSNVLDNKNNKGQLLPNTERSVVFTVEGVKVGLVGVLLSSLSKDYITILDPMETAKSEVNRLRNEEKVDILIMMSHQSLADDIAFANQIPGIDLIAGGHEHENMYFVRGSTNIPIAKADANARTAYVHSLSFDTSSKKLLIDSKLTIMNDDIPSDPIITKRVNKWMKKVFNAYTAQGYKPEQTLAKINIELNGLEGSVRNRATKLTDLVASSALNAFKTAELSLVNAGSIRIDDILVPGKVTQYDALRVLPFGGDYSLVSIKGAVLERALNAGLKNKGSGGFLHYSNVQRDVNKQWLVNDKQLDANKNYKMAVASFLIERGDTNLKFLVNNPDIKKLSERKAQARDALFDEFRLVYPL
jgi:5'-nucleotidase/UDP-sugar diphosphatase